MDEFRMMSFSPHTFRHLYITKYYSFLREPPVLKCIPKGTYFKIPFTNYVYNK